MVGILLMIGLLAGDADLERAMREIEELEQVDCQKEGEKIFEKCSGLCRQTAQRTNDKTLVRACLNDCHEAGEDVRSSCKKGQDAVREFRKKSKAEQEKILKEDISHENHVH